MTDPQIALQQDSQFASEFNADVSREKLAAVYAKALAGACDAKNVSFDEMVAQYESFLSVLTTFPKFEQILASALVPTREKQRMVDEIFSTGTPVFRNFLQTVAKRGRFELLRDVYHQAVLLDKKRQNRIMVTITTATLLSNDSHEALAGKLRGLLGSEPEIRTIVDPETIGGIIVRVDDTVYDASLATQLINVRQQMIDRSTHEIQSRRDRFRNTEGN